MADVFISYKSERRAAAEHLADILEDHGYSVWFDYALATGGSFSEQIARELEAAKCVVVLWCSLSVNSKWVKREASFAQDRQKICPAFIENVSLPFPFHHEQTINLQNWDGAPRAGQPASLLREIEQHTGKPPQPDTKLLARAEKAWKRYGSQSLAKFALGEIVQEQEAEPDFGVEPAGPQPIPNPIAKPTEPTPPPKLDTPSARAWEKIKNSDRLHDFDVFLQIFPDAPETEECTKTREQLSRRLLNQTRKDAFEALPRGEYDVSVFERFIDAHPHTDEAFEAALLKKDCEIRLAALPAPDDETREQWELEATVQIVMGQPIPAERRQFLQDLSISGRNHDLFDALKEAGADLSEIYIDPDAMQLKRKLLFNDLTPVEELTQLKELSCYNTQVNDLTPLQKLTKLTELDCGSTQVSDLTPLKDLTQLNVLACDYTQVSDLTPLKELTKLRELYCKNTQVTDWSPVDHIDRVDGRPRSWKRKPRLAL